MKRLKFIFVAISILGLVGGALAFKANKSALTIWILNEDETACYSISPTKYNSPILGLPTISFTNATYIQPINLASCKYTIIVRPE